jgi:hypothetical protein
MSLRCVKKCEFSETAICPFRSSGYTISFDNHRRCLPPTTLSVAVKMKSPNIIQLLVFQQKAYFNVSPEVRVFCDPGKLTFIKLASIFRPTYACA